MDVAEFEQDILKLAFETDARITTASVAYYLGLPSSEVEPMLDKLLEKGVLELDSDDEGNLFYRVPDGAREQARSLPHLKHGRNTSDSIESSDAAMISGEGPNDFTQGAGDGQDGAPGVEGAVNGGARPDADEDDIEPLSPKQHAPEAEATREENGEEVGVDGGLGADEAPAESPVVGAYGAASKTVGEKREINGAVERGSSDAVFGTVSRRDAATDASVDNCGDSTVIADTEAQCEPRPIADSQPTFTSCNDSVSSEEGSTSLVQSAGESARSMEQFYYDNAWEENQQESAQASGGAAAGSLVQRSEGQLQRPEHQPGMSLLLSLILCGTGQIYNGEVSKGIMMMVLCFLLWFVLLGWVVHIWSIVDSVVVAERMNREGEQ